MATLGYKREEKATNPHKELIYHHFSAPSCGQFCDRWSTAPACDGILYFSWRKSNFESTQWPKIRTWQRHTWFGRNNYAPPKLHITYQQPAHRKIIIFCVFDSSRPGVVLWPLLPRSILQNAHLATMATEWLKLMAMLVWVKTYSWLQKQHRWAILLMQSLIGTMRSTTMMMQLTPVMKTKHVDTTLRYYNI